MQKTNVFTQIEHKLIQILFFERKLKNYFQKNAEVALISP